MAQNKLWFLVQTLLLLSVLFWPFKMELPLPAVIRGAGLILLLGGLVLAAAALSALKHSIRSSPEPKTGGKLITTGLYSVVRHPAYSALIISAFGLSLWAGDGVRLALSVCLFLFFDLKSRREEKRLGLAYPEYAGYKMQVRKRLIPWVY
ncbi:MAG: isoprenylcysteine carboxylmethyltransferase family protein [Elusimicrobia bacterium HGW-Elusimicrobia-3]|nr:MAG: isoprenylcysteine carboxylmethyltransferase family protein [Elusimicrobia bacterium HGW-Elusimicrobia-3]